MAGMHPSPMTLHMKKTFFAKLNHFAAKTVLVLICGVASFGYGSSYFYCREAFVGLSVGLCAVGITVWLLASLDIP